MDLAAQPLTTGKRAPASAAKLAYFEGDFERCLAICAEIRVRSLSTASEVALLRARSYLRTGRPREAEVEIRESLETHAGVDAALTAQMLLGTARIRQADADGGLAILEAATQHSADAHFAIRSEIAYATAFGYWAKRDLDTAERYLGRVDRRSDIIHARALELSAWCQMARGNYRRCADFFILALLRLDYCRAQDRAIVATAISTLSILAAELFDAQIARVAEFRARAMQWTSGLVMQHYLTLLHQALFLEMTGDTVGAYELALQARDIAPTTAFEAYALSVTATIARNAGEAHCSVMYAQRAQKVLATLELRELTGEERFSMLAVAECCAHFDVAGAEQLFASYWGLASADTIIALSGDPRLAAEETFIAGIIAQARGDIGQAERCYREAFEKFSGLGYVRRAIMVAFALFKQTGDSALHKYLCAQLDTTSNYVTRYVAARQAATMPPLAHNPMLAALPSAQREVVTLICQGKTNKQIAALRNVSEQTVKNMLTKHVYRKLGVTNRAALISICLRRSG